MIRLYLLIFFVPFLTSCAGSKNVSVGDNNSSHQSAEKIEVRTFTPPESENDLHLDNANLYVHEMNQRKFEINIVEKFDFYEPKYEFRSKWYWMWYLDFSQRRDLFYDKTSFVKVGSVIYEDSILPLSVFKSGEKIETFSKGYITQQKLKYRPIPWR